MAGSATFIIHHSSSPLALRPSPQKGAPMALDENKALVRRYYNQLWNNWDTKVADEIIATDIGFRGSLGVMTRGLEGFKQYVDTVRAAFPDFHNAIEDLIAEGDKVVARLTY